MADIIPENPKARAENLLIEDVSGELLILDVSTNRAHCLNESAAAIWRHCDGTRSVNSLASHLFPELAPADAQRLVSLGVERLRRRRLLETSAAGAPKLDMTKRQLLKKVAILATAAGVAAPLVTSILTPTAAHAFSCLPSGSACSNIFECCTFCNGGTCA
jgi:Coenzyme PQQ synthesis protein D (PqqD)